MVENPNQRKHKEKTNAFCPALNKRAGEQSMKFECEKTLLANAIDGVSRAITNRAAIPVLEGIYLKAEGFTLTLTGYDMEMGITTTIECNVLVPGETVLDAKLLGSLVSRMPAGDICIELTDEGQAKISGGVAEFEIPALNASDYPSLPVTGADNTMTVKCGMLREMIEKTIYAVSQDDKKPAHTGELFVIEPGSLTIVALDGVAVIVNADSKVENLTVEQIGKIFTGEITDWSEVGGDAGTISCIGREAGSGTRDGFESITGTKDACKLDQELTSTGGVIEAVAGNPNAIGYASLSAVEGKNTVKDVTVGGVACTEETVLNGSYAIQRPFVLVTKTGETLSPAAQAFFDYATSSAASQLIKAAGAVPVAK